MSNIAALLKSTAEKTPDDDKLLDLYWNRNELKKEFAELRNEKFRLQDLIKQRDGALARMEQKLEHIEELLIDAEWARSTLVHYQLKGVGVRCQRKLARFAEQLKLQREQKQRAAVLAEWQSGIDAERHALEERIASHDAMIAQLDASLREENEQLSGMNGLLRPFRTRSISASIDELGKQIQVEEQARSVLQAELQALAERSAPDNTGLDLASKRSINFMILAYAQQLCMMFEDDDLVALVKEAGEKSAGAINYGDRMECEQILERLASCSGLLDKSTDFADLLKKRAVMIGDDAMFQNDEDAVPVSGSVATLYRIAPNGVISKGDINVLGDDYWGVSGVLSR